MQLLYIICYFWNNNFNSSLVQGMGIATFTRDSSHPIDIWLFTSFKENHKLKNVLATVEKVWTLLSFAFPKLQLMIYYLVIISKLKMIIKNRDYFCLYIQTSIKRTPFVQRKLSVLYRCRSWAGYPIFLCSQVRWKVLSPPGIIFWIIGLLTIIHQ